MARISLPTPYDDELLYSVLARYFAYLQPRTPSPAYRTISGSAGRFQVRFATNVSKIAAMTRATWQKSEEQIITEHTLLPFYGRQLPHELYDRCIRVFCSEGGLHFAPTRLSLSSSTIAEPKRLKF